MLWEMVKICENCVYTFLTLLKIKKVTSPASGYPKTHYCI